MTGLIENGNDIAVSVFPNPASDNLNINVISNGDEKIIIQVVNTLGQIIRSVDLGIMFAGNNTKALITECRFLHLLNKFFKPLPMFS